MTSRRDFIGHLSALGAVGSRGSDVPLDLAQGAPVPGVVNVRANGALGDGKANDTGAVKAAIAACAAAGGGIVFFPTGVYDVAEQILVPSLVRLVGTGSRSSHLRARPGFPGDTAVVRLGNGKEYGFSCGVEQMQIECSHVFGSWGVFSSDLQENGCVSNVVINSYHRGGIQLDGDAGVGISNFYLENLELLASSGTRDSTGILIKAGSWKNRIENVSIVPHFSDGGYQGAAIRVVGGKLDAHGIHIEYHREGVVFDEGSHGSLSDVDGEYVNNLVRIKTPGRVLVLFAYRSKGDSILVNETLGQTLLDGALAFYAQDGGADSYSITSSRNGSSDLTPLRIGGGAAIAGHLSATGKWVPGRVLNGAAVGTTVKVPGARAGDTVAVGFSHPVPTGIMLSGTVSAADLVSVTLANLSGKAATVAEGTIRTDVWQH